MSKRYWIFVGGLLLKCYVLHTCMIEFQKVEVLLHCHG